VQKGATSIRPCAEAEFPEEETPSTGLTGSKKERKSTSSSRFTIYKVNKASRKKREKSSAKKERKATKTLAIVLGKHFFFIVFSNQFGLRGFSIY
jgi:dopamine D2-like receptor